MAKQEEEGTDGKPKTHKSWVLLIVTIGIWIYWFNNRHRIEAWKMAFFNGIMLYGIIIAYRQVPKDDE